MRALIAMIPVMLAVAACDRQAAPPPQPKAETTAAAKSEMAGFDERQRGTPAPETPFRAPDGKAVTLANFRGTPVLVNLWATWCGPCVKEMPALDRVAARMAGRMTVLTVNQMDNPDKLDAWWKARALKNLKPYAEPDGKLGFAFGSGMLPTTVLYSRDGQEVWRVVGEMDWEGAEARGRLAAVQ